MIPLVVLAGLMSSTSDGEAVLKQVKPIHVSNESDRDLEPVRKAIGGARIVQLGELTHGDGTSFALKTRLVKYLHEKAGFDVLIWESGLLEGEQLDEGLKGKDPVQDVARKAVFSHWSRSKESIGVFEYARQTYASRRPLAMAGFDIQSSGREGNLVFLRLVDAVGDRALMERAAEIRALPEGEAKESAALELAPALKTALAQNRDRLIASKGKAYLDALQQKVNSMVAYDQMMKSYRRFQQVQTGAEFQVGYNLRERANFENLKWLVDHRYKGKKVIVWAHNSHVSHNGATGSFWVAGPNDLVLDSTGRLLKQAYGARLYTIGFLASGGKWSWMGQPAQDFSEAKPGSIEELLGRSGASHAFLDLRPVAKHLSEPMDGYINRQDPQLNHVVWPKVFDGLIYIREMKPRTQLP